jgi:isochorismate synthase EntC
MMAVVDAAMTSLVDSLSSPSPPLSCTVALPALTTDMAHQLAARMPGPRMIMIAADGAFALCGGATDRVVRAPATLDDLAAICATSPSPMVVTAPFDVAQAPAGTVLGYAPRLCMWQRRGHPAQLTVRCEDGQHQQAVSLLQSWLQAKPPAPSKPTTSSWQHNLDEHSHAQRIGELLRAIGKGDVHKVISARTTTATIRGLELTHTLRQLHQLEPTTTALLIDNLDDPSSTWLGASPEWLCRRDGHVVHIDVLAGTMGRGGDGSTDAAVVSSLLVSTKDQAEHAFVGNDIVEVVRPLSLSVDIDALPAIKQLRHVHHLHRQLRATLVTSAPLFHRLHPTSAVCGTPGAAAMEIIRVLEPARGMYAGAVGVAMADGEDVAVVLRCAHVRGEQIVLYAGGGIVAGSEAAAEWRELDHKVASWRDLLGAP